MAKTRKINNRVPVKSCVPRTISFYDIALENEPLHIEHEYYSPSTGLNHALVQALLLNHISKPPRDRFFINGPKKLAFSDFDYDNVNKNLRGKLILFRDDLNPEIANTASGQVRDIDMDNDESIIEKTHFVLHFTKNDEIILGIEYNHSGPRVSDLAYCLKQFFKNQLLATDLKAIPIVKEGLVERVKSIGNVTSMKFKVINDYKFKLRKTMPKLYSILNTTEEFFKNQYLEFVVKYDFKEYKQSMDVKDIVNRLVGFLKKNKENYEVFDQLVISGENLDNNSKKEEFDLLEFRLQFERLIEKDAIRKRIVSSDIFSKIVELINSEFYGIHN